MGSQAAPIDLTGSSGPPTSSRSTEAFERDLFETLVQNPDPANAPADLGVLGMNETVQVTHGNLDPALTHFNAGAEPGVMTEVVYEAEGDVFQHSG